MAANLGVPVDFAVVPNSSKERFVSLQERFKSLANWGSISKVNFVKVDAWLRGIEVNTKNPENISNPALTLHNKTSRKRKEKQPPSASKQQKKE